MSPQFLSEIEGKTSRGPLYGLEACLEGTCLEQSWRFCPGTSSLKGQKMVLVAIPAYQILIWSFFQRHQLQLLPAFPLPCLPATRRDKVLPPRESGVQGGTQLSPGLCLAEGKYVCERELSHSLRRLHRRKGLWMGTLADKWNLKR